MCPKFTMLCFVKFIAKHPIKHNFYPLIQVYMKRNISEVRKLNNENSNGSYHEAKKFFFQNGCFKTKKDSTGILRAIKTIQTGLTHRQVAIALSGDRRIIDHLCNRYIQTGVATDRPRSWRPD